VGPAAGTLEVVELHDDDLRPFRIDAEVQPWLLTPGLRRVALDGLTGRRRRGPRGRLLLGREAGDGANRRPGKNQSGHERGWPTRDSVQVATQSRKQISHTDGSTAKCRHEDASDR